MKTWDRALTALALTIAASLLTVVPAGTTTAASAAGASASVVAASSAATAATPRWRPRRGPVFNNPTGSKAARHAIATRIKDAVRHAPRGSTIRFATYSFDRKDVATLLIRAHRRGVHVQVVVNDNSVSKQELRMQRYFGKNRNRSSFLIFCKGSCRSSGGNLHIKIYSFSQTGAAKGVIISSSANLAYGGSFAQWNDGYTLYGDQRLFTTWVRVFRQLKRDRRSTPRQVTYSSSNASLVFHRELERSMSGKAATTEVESRPASRKASSDPVVQRLAKVGCRAPRGYGRDGRTVLKIAVFAWYGNRGNNIARQVTALARKGCRIRVIGSVLGESTGKILQGAGISVKAADWDFGKRVSSGDEDKIVYGPRCYMHYKFFTVNGSYAGKPLKAVWTGSENWSGISFANDEVTLRINNAAVQRRYAAQFDWMWDHKNASHGFGVEPTRRPCAYS